jgi:hypothetical protein
MTLEDCIFTPPSLYYADKLTAKHVMSINKDDIRSVRKHSQLISQFKIRTTYDCSSWKKEPTDLSVWKEEILIG